MGRVLGWLLAIGAVGVGVVVAKNAMAGSGPVVSSLITLAPGVQSIAASPGQTVTVNLPAGGVWTVGVLLAGTNVSNIQGQGGSGPVTFTVPPAVGPAFLAAWVQSGATGQSAVVLLTAPGQSTNALVTDPNAVAYAQTTLTKLGQAGTVGGLTYGVPSSSQTYVQGLQTFQQWVNSQNILGSSGVSIRTDGSLDYATLALLTAASMGFI